METLRDRMEADLKIGGSRGRQSGEAGRRRVRGEPRANDVPQAFRRISVLCERAPETFDRGIAASALHRSSNAALLAERPQMASNHLELTAP